MLRMGDFNIDFYRPVQHYYSCDIWPAEWLEMLTEASEYLKKKQES